MNNAIRVNGATRLYAIVGDPVVQVRSPEVYCERFAQAGINAVLVAAQVSPANFDVAVPGLMALGNLDGLLVTAPFKARMASLAQRLGSAAACIGAVNALRRESDGSWSGDMFDGAGFVRGIERKGRRLQGRRVLLFGAGGAGSAIACALLVAGVASIRIVNPEAEKTEALVAALRRTFAQADVQAAGDDRSGFDMVVNASPVGMKPDDGLPGPLGPLSPEVLVGDVVVSEAPTAIIREAVAHGSPWVNGHDMHSGQIEAIMAFFHPDAQRAASAA
mgnify:CR=1 FL=1